jgi:hypothetical protein
MIENPTQPSLPPTTTHEQDKTLAGQRKVNIIWEVTQATIAVLITLAVVIVGVYDALNQIVVPAPPILSNAFFLIVGFYFSRTNHQAIGGVGPKSNEGQEYIGR